MSVFSCNGLRNVVVANILVLYLNLFEFTSFLYLCKFKKKKFH